MRVVTSPRLLLASSVVLGTLSAACAGVTPSGGRLPSSRAAQPVAAVVESRGQPDVAGVSSEELGQLYAAAGRPSVGFIRDRYQLPVANPLGAARIIEGNVLGMPLQQSVVAPSTERPYAVVPLEDGFAVQQLALVQQDLARAGVSFVEITTADANRIVTAEQQATQSRGWIQWNEMAPSGADVLVSFQESMGLGGPLYIVRMIRMADGALLSLRTGPAQGGAVALRPLLARAIADGLQAAAAHPLR